MLRAEAHLHITRAKAGKDDCISLRKLPNFQVEYVGYATFKDVKFAVQPAGLKRFREKGQKNVHAYVRGTLSEATANQQAFVTDLAKRMREAKYNPLVNDTFVDSVTGNPVLTARVAVMNGRKVYYLP